MTVVRHVALNGAQVRLEFGTTAQSDLGCSLTSQALFRVRGYSEPLAVTSHPTSQLDTMLQAVANEPEYAEVPYEVREPTDCCQGRFRREDFGQCSATAPMQQVVVHGRESAVDVGEDAIHPDPNQRLTGAHAPLIARAGDIPNITGEESHTCGRSPCTRSDHDAPSTW